MPGQTFISQLLKIFGSIVVLLGLGVSFYSWWSGETFWDSFVQALGFLITGGLFILVSEGLQTGKLGIKGGNVTRDGNPIMFWGCATLYVIVGSGLLVGLCGILFLGG